MTKAVRSNPGAVNGADEKVTAPKPVAKPEPKVIDLGNGTKRIDN